MNEKTSISILSMEQIREAEQSVIGGFITHHMHIEIIQECKKIITAKDFENKKFAVIFDAIFAMFHCNTTPSYLALINWLNNHTKNIDDKDDKSNTITLLEYIGGTNEIDTATNLWSPAKNNLIHYTEIVVLQSCKRQLKKAYQNNSHPEIIRSITGHIDYIKNRSSSCYLKTDSKGKIQKSLSNLSEILRKHSYWKESFFLNLFSNYIEITHPEFSKFTDLTPSSVTQVRLLLEKHFDTNWSKETTLEIITNTATHNEYHPIRNFLENLEWDQKPRLNNWLHVYATADNTKENALLGSKFLIGAVARVMLQPTKMDWLLILEGTEGIGKSSLVKILFGQKYISEEGVDPAKFRNPNESMSLRGKWAIEFAEIDKMFTNTNTAILKSFLTKEVDRYRVPWGLTHEDFARQNVFIGTTNQLENYLPGEGKNRRFAPVRLYSKVFFDLLKIDRKQLWAEAVYRFKQGEEWHLDDDSTTLQMLRDSRAHKPNWSDSLDEFLNEYNIDKIHTSIIASHLGFDDKKPPDSFSKDLKNWMEKRGWKSGQFRSNGKKGRGYIK